MGAETIKRYLIQPRDTVDQGYIANITDQEVKRMVEGARGGLPDGQVFAPDDKTGGRFVASLYCLGNTKKNETGTS